MPWFACARLFLRRQVEAAASLGIDVSATFELEFYLCRPTADGGLEALPRRPVYSTIGLDDTQPAMSAIVDALVGRGIAVEGILNEYGAGQHELSVAPADPLTAADTEIAVRDTVRGTALVHGYRASFAPKPFLDQIGSGAHLHLSLWDADGQRNLLYAPSADGGLSALGRHFIAGVTDHLPALAALTSPSYNSFRRLTPSAWAAATTAWGFDNREAALRVCSPFHGREEQSYNLEFKTSDGSANPYLSLGALITCGLDGIARGLEPGEPSAHDPARMTPEELSRGRVRPLPTSMGAALEQLQQDDVLLGSMDELLARCYLAVRRSEVEEFSVQDQEFEIRHHFYRF